MPNFVDGTRLVRGVNPSKSLRRFVADVRMRVKNDKDEYRLLPKRKERAIFNQKHICQAQGAYEDHIASKDKGQTSVSFSSCLPDGYKDFPVEVKYGYYLHPEITELIVNGSAGEFVSVAAEAARTARAEAASKGREIDVAKLPTPEDYPKQALHNFRSLLRGEKFDVASAILGAKMILRWDWDNNNKLPAELHDLAYRLWSAKDRISEGSNFPSTVGFVFGTVVHTNALEVGDVHVRTPVAGKIAFRTKAINNNKTRFGFLKKKARSPGATESKVSAAYQSLYHAARLAKNPNDQTPFFLEVRPLYGSTGDGSDASKEAAARTALMEAVRFVTIYPNVRVKFGGGSRSHKAFRKSFGRQLNAIFSYEIGKPVKTAIKLKENTSVLTHARGSRASRSLADLNATLTIGSSSNPNSSGSISEDEGALSDSQAERRATRETGSSSSDSTDFFRREGSKFHRNRPIEEGKRLVNAEREAEESEGSSKSDDAFGSIESAEVTDVVTPEKQECKSALLDRGAPNSNAESDSSSYASEHTTDRIPRSLSSVGGGQATLGVGNSNSKGKGSIRVDPVRYEKLELHLPELSLSSDSETIHIKGHVERLIDKSNKEKKPAGKNEKITPEVSKPGKRSVISRGAKLAHDFFYKKSKGKKNGLEATGNVVAISDKRVVTGQYQPEEVLGLVGRLTVGRPSPGEVFPAKNAEHELEKSKKRLATLVHPLLDRWTNISESTEIDARQLLKDVEVFARYLGQYRLRVSGVKPHPGEGRVGVNAEKTWVEHCEIDIHIITIGLSGYSLAGEHGARRS